MTTEPKPYTLAEWRARLSPHIFEMIQEELRERGLIAEEPVDPLLVEARQIIADTCDTHESKGQWLDGVWDDEQEMDIALAALRRGMELGRSDCSEALAPRKELTREMVDRGESLAGRLCDWDRDGEKPVPLMQEAAAYIRALTEADQ